MANAKLVKSLIMFMDGGRLQGDTIPMLSSEITWKVTKNKNIKQVNIKLWHYIDKS